LDIRSTFNISKAVRQRPGPLVLWDNIAATMIIVGKCRRVAFMPGVKYYKPAGVHLRFLDEVCLSIEDLESVRLKDLEDFDQEKCAQRMNISRSTFQCVPGSTARFTRHLRDSYQVGALARFNINHDKLHPKAKKVAQTFGLKAPCYNPYFISVAQIVETVHAMEMLVRAYDPCISCSTHLLEVKFV